jgi:ABC-type transport system involved in multi-copper enzyme maturation permease subunit
MGVRTIAGLTCREAARRKILLAAAVLGGAFLILFGVGLYLIVENAGFRGGPGPRMPALMRRQASNVLMIMGLYAVNWLVVMLTVLVSVDTLAGEISSGTIQAVVTKPIRRWQVVVGKWIGFASLLTPFLVLMAGGVMVEAWFLTGYAPSGVPRAIALIWLESMLLLAVTFRAGASLSTLATGVVAFGLHVLAFLGGWIEEFGSIAQSQTAVNIGVLASLAMPSEALWRKAASALQGPIIGGFGRTPFSVASVPSAGMVAYAAIYTAIALSLAVRRFSRRDL